MSDQTPARQSDIEFLADVSEELRRAREHNEPINSAHEGYAVILEEVNEFWEEVRRKRTEQSSLPWTVSEAQDFATHWNLNQQIASLLTQQQAVWDRYCKSRDARREAAYSS